MSFYAKTGGPFGYPLFQRKPAQVVAKCHPLTVPERTRVTTLYGLAMGRLPEDLYDPVLVTDDVGGLRGIVTIRQLIQRANELEIQWATGANPLTGLPGNSMIQRWIQEAIAHPPFSLVYADLDRFKEYNDGYGFVMGEGVIRLTAHLLSEELSALSPRAQLGHLGGDDFVIVCGGLVAEQALERICRIFDEARLARFDPEDRERGFFVASDRRGRRVEVPLVTLSLAVGPVTRGSAKSRWEPNVAFCAAPSSSIGTRENALSYAPSRSYLASEVPVPKEPHPDDFIHWFVDSLSPL